MTKRPREAGRPAPARSPAPRTTAPRDSSRAPSSGMFPYLAELVDPRAPYLIPLLLLLATRIAAWIAIGDGAEDAYITYRYAHHLATGNGLVYNPGERVMGFSSPLWTVWNSLGYLLTHDPVQWSRISGVGSDVVTLVL